jgi:lipoate-protein ligase A
MDVSLLPRLIRIGRDRIVERGVRSAEKAVSPLSWFTSLSCAEVAQRMHESFAREFHTRSSELSGDELEAALSLVASKYSTPAWIDRLP